jgi:hypothetical protein
MNIEALNSYTRFAALEEFRQVLERAQMRSLFRRIAARENPLEDFRSLLPALQPNRRYLGTIEVPVDRIVGTVDRGADFDGDFRPLTAHLRDRWVSVYLLAGNGDWPPVRLYKAGDRYFVEDGHNRVSVARTLGRPTIRADVWEYPMRPEKKDRPGNHANFGDLPLADCCE